MFSCFFGRKHAVRKVSIRGPLENVGGKMLLLIPLDAGGTDLSKSAGKIAYIEDGYLKVEIKPWMAEKLDIHIGSLVSVDNLDGEFRITRINEDLPNQ